VKFREIKNSETREIYERRAKAFPAPPHAVAAVPAPLATFPHFLGPAITSFANYDTIAENEEREREREREEGGWNASHCRGKN